MRDALDLLRRDDAPLGERLPDLATLADPVDDGDEVSEGPAARGRAELDLVMELARDHLRLNPGARAPDFATWLVATFTAEGGDGWGDAVTLATFHAAKGLEWPIVHLAGLEDGYVPITHARTAAERAEEARLLYVAMTRAEDELRCSWAAERTFGGRISERRLTPWLAGLAERQREPSGDDRPEPAPDWRERLADQRAQLAEVGSGRPPSADARCAVGVAGGTGPGGAGRAGDARRRPAAGGDRRGPAGDDRRAGGDPGHGPAAGGPDRARSAGGAPGLRVPIDLSRSARDK